MDYVRAASVEEGLAETESRPTAAATANAIFHTTGARISALLLIPERVQDAVKAARARRP